MLHPVHFSKKLLEPTAVRVQNKNLMLWRDSKNKVVCFPNVCPHRGAQLTKGRIIDGGERVQCSYHGWQFDNKGTCAKVPQAAENQYIPRSCNIEPWEVVEKSGVIWVAPPGPCVAANEPNISMSDAFVTEYVLDAQYSYDLQIENLLDPAHIHFVHNGFQGKEAEAGHITAKNICVDHKRSTITGIFKHTNNKKIPTIRIVFHWPFVVDVSIFNQNMEVVRKNVIYIIPQTTSTCRVLFRDVAYKEFLAPPLVRMWLGAPSLEEAYQTVNKEVVEAIMQQDVNIIESQQANMHDHKRDILLTESDKMIVAYRKFTASLSMTRPQKLT